MSKSPANPAVSVSETAPYWLTRTEKATFKRLIADRKRLNLPITELVLDAATDYVLIRQRIAELQESLDDARQEPSDLDWERKYKLSLYRELDRATRLAAEFAEKLGK